MAGPTMARRGDQSSPSGLPPVPERRRGRWPRLPGRRAPAAALVVAVLLGGFTGWALYGSSWFRVEHVRTSGTRVLTPDEVRGAAGVRLNSPLVSVDTDEVAAALRAQLPRIAAVDVVRSWPNRIGLKVTEREPVAVIKKGRKFIELDAEGVRYATVGRAPENVPLLELDAAASPSLRRFGVERLRREAARVAARLPGAMRRETRTVSVRSYDDITLELTGGRKVNWGSGEDGAAKVKALRVLIKTERGADHFDVSAPTAPAASGS